MRRDIDDARGLARARVAACGGGRGPCPGRGRGPARARRRARAGGRGRARHRVRGGRPPRPGAKDPPARAIAPGPRALFAAAAVLYVAMGLWYASRLRVSGDEPHYLLMAQSLWREGDLDLADNLAREDWRENTPGPVQPHFGAPRARMDARSRPTARDCRSCWPPSTPPGAGSCASSSLALAGAGGDRRRVAARRAGGRHRRGRVRRLAGRPGPSRRVLRLPRLHRGAVGAGAPAARWRSCSGRPRWRRRWEPPSWPRPCPGCT